MVLNRISVAWVQSDHTTKKSHSKKKDERNKNVLCIPNKQIRKKRDETGRIRFESVAAPCDSFHCRRCRLHSHKDMCVYCWALGNIVKYILQDIQRSFFLVFSLCSIKCVSSLQLFHTLRHGINFVEIIQFSFMLIMYTLYTCQLESCSFNERANKMKSEINEGDNKRHNQIVKNHVYVQSIFSIRSLYESN